MTVARLALAAAALVVSTPVAAQQGSALPVLPPLVGIVEPDDALIGVAERYRPDYQPRGFRTGSFLVYPSVETGAGYDTNIFANGDNAVSDAFLSIAPRVSARSTWSTSELQLRAEARHNEFVGTRNADETSYQAAADGRFELLAPLQLETGLSYGQRIERRDSSSFPDGTSSNVAPIRFRVGGGYARATYGAGTTRFIATADLYNFAFSDAQLLDGDENVITRLDQSFRDRTIIRVGGRAEYVLAPQIAMYGQGGYARLSYDRDLIAPAIPNRDANELQAMGGVTLNVGLLRGRVGVGYVRHAYNAARYATISGLAVDSQLTYYFSPLLTFNLEASRTVEETAILEASGFLSTRVQVRADYELLRNLLLNLSASYRDNAFEGIDRRDSIFRVTGGGRWSASRRIAFDLAFAYVDRNVDGAPFVTDYNDLRVSLATVFQF